jgi:predicted porin
MKKILLPLATFGAISFAAMAHAQSNVTMYGMIDLGVGRAIGNDAYSMMQGAASRVGFKGQEDLGSGWKTSFHLQHRFNADTGAAQSDKFWHADSWVGLEGPYGQVRLGRMFTPAYEYVMLPADVFQHSRVGSNIAAQTGKVSPYRFDNGVNYNVKTGGLRFGITYAADETAGPSSTDNAYSAAMSYTTGNLYVAIGHENPSDAHDSWNTLTARWGDDALKVFAFVGNGTNKSNHNLHSYSIGASGKVGHGKLMASYARLDNKDMNTTEQDKFAVGYYYALSKRSTVYTNLAHDRAAASHKHKNSTGFDFGIVHSF